MLQVAVKRLRELWPNAIIHVVTEKPDLLPRYCPDVVPVAWNGLNLWWRKRHHYLFGGRVHQIIPASFSRLLSRVEEEISLQWPWLAESIIEFTSKRRNALDESTNEFLEAFFSTDLVVLSGGGTINDEFQGYAIKILDFLGFVIRCGKPVALVGHGIGPIHDPRSVLSRKAGAVLPLVDIICVREKLSGPNLLKSLGVAPERIIETGDDAIEMAYEARLEELGIAMGFNIRVAIYSGVSGDNIKAVQTSIQKMANSYNVPIVPVPILKTDGATSDLESIHRLLSGTNCDVLEGPIPDHPLEVIQQIGLCRIVVTGSYHGAVFALAQGISAVCLVNSQYYATKFLGLADQFVGGCRVVHLGNKDSQDQLLRAIEKAWNSAEEVRSQLLHAAEGHIEIGRAAYLRIYETLVKNEIAA